MYRILLIFGLICALSRPDSFAQKNKADSLLAVLQSARADTARISTLLELYKVFSARNIDSARMFVSQAIQAAEASGRKKQQALALKTMGNSYYLKDNNAALGYWEKSLALYQSIRDSAGEANLLSNIGALWMNEGDDSKAMEYYVSALQLGELLRDTLRISTVLNNMGSVYNHNESTKLKALEMYHRSLPMSETLKDQNSIGTTYSNIAEVNLSIGRTDSAIYFSLKSLKALQGTERMFLPLKVLGDVYDSLGNYSRAISYYLQGDSIAVQFRNQRYEILSKSGLGDLYYKMGEYGKSFAAFSRAEELARLARQHILLKDVYKGLARNYAVQNDFRNAFNIQQMLTALNDTLSNDDMRKKMFGITYNYELQKSQNEVNLLTKDKQIADANLRRQKFAKNALIAGLGLVSLIIFILYRDYLNKIKTNKILDNQKAQIQTLLSNILPDEVAEELQRDGVATPRFYESASVLFTDFKSFTKLADRLSPQEVVAELNACFNVFDDIIVRYGLEKIKTIGDAYMCAGGIPVEDPDHYKKMVRAARDIQQYIRQRNQEREATGLQPWEIRIGIHLGPIVAGVVGKKKYAYDIWGSTVNIASRMESNGEPGQINISSALYELVKEKYHCTYRGKIYAKNVGEIDMYFLGDEIKDGEKPDMANSGSAVQNSFLDLPLSDKQRSLPAIEKYELIRQTALHRLKDLDPGLTYHCFDHTLDVLEQSERIAAAEGITDPEKIFVLKVAALYHDTGFLKTYKNHEEASYQIFLEDAPNFGFTDFQKSEIQRLIMVTQIPQRPQDILEKVICDADLDYLGRDDFFSIGDTLRREFIRYGIVPDDAAWESLQMKFLTNHSYHTESSRILREPKKQAHISRLTV